MKKPLSDLTPMDFVHAVKALGTNYKGVAVLLGKSPSTISAYVDGRQAIPEDAAQKLRELLAQREKELTQAKLTLDTASIINPVLRPAWRPASTEGRLYARLRKPDTRDYPAMRLTIRQAEIALAALKAWRDKMIERHQTTSGRAHEEVARELADIKCIAGRWPRSLPYRVVINRDEWQVMSRALRGYAVTDPYAYSFYQTWRKNRYHGKA